MGPSRRVGPAHVRPPGRASRYGAAGGRPQLWKAAIQVADCIQVAVMPALLAAELVAGPGSATALGHFLGFLLGAVLLAGL